jgi:hypothetical protein
VNGDAIALLLHDCGDHGYTSSILDEIGPRCVEQSLCVATGVACGLHRLVDVQEEGIPTYAQRIGILNGIFAQPTAVARSVAQRGLDMLPRIGEG